jgi:hypothetical protein
MAHLIMMYFGSEIVENMGLWIFLSVGAIALFGIFIPVVTYIDKRAQEREAYYKAETMRRLAESSTEGAKMAIDLLREEGRQKQIKRIEGLKIGGLINVGVGIALIAFLRSLVPGDQGTPYLCGLIPGFVGVAMLVYAFFLARPVE